MVHTTAVSETVLKDAGVKLKGGRKRKALVEHNAAAWAQGKRDATQIDLNQNALGGPKRPTAIGPRQLTWFGIVLISQIYTFHLRVVQANDS